MWSLLNSGDLNLRTWRIKVIDIPLRHSVWVRYRVFDLSEALYTHKFFFHLWCLLVCIVVTYESCYLNKTCLVNSQPTATVQVISSPCQLAFAQRWIGGLFMVGKFKILNSQRDKSFIPKCKNNHQVGSAKTKSGQYYRHSYMHNCRQSAET